MTKKQTIISSAIAMIVFNIKTSYFIFQQKMKSGSYMSSFGVIRSKLNLPATFWVHSFSDRISEHI